MDNRKLVQHGLSSLSVVLPSKWLKEHNLKKGDSIYYNVEGSKIVLSTNQPFKIENISVDITGLDRTSIIYYIQSLYRFGYNEIELTFDKPKTIHYRKSAEKSVSSIVYFAVNRLIGAEIIEQLKDRVLIKFVTKESETDFQSIVRRAFLILKETAHGLLEGIRDEDSDLILSIEDKHDNITKFISYALRLLNKFGYPDIKKTSFYYHIIASLDKIADIMKYNARSIIDKKIKFSKATIELVEDINNSIIKYYNLFYKFDLMLIDELSKNRDYIKNQINKKINVMSKQEIRFIANMTQILEIILDLTEARMGLEYEKQKIS